MVHIPHFNFIEVYRFKRKSTLHFNNDLIIITKILCLKNPHPSVTCPKSFVHIAHIISWQVSTCRNPAILQYVADWSLIFTLTCQAFTSVYHVWQEHYRRAYDCKWQSLETSTFNCCVIFIECTHLCSLNWQDKGFHEAKYIIYCVPYFSGCDY